MALTTTLDAPMGFGPQEAAYAVISEVHVDFVTGGITVAWVAYRDKATRDAQKAAIAALHALLPQMQAATRDRENPAATADARLAAEQANLGLVRDMERLKREVRELYVPMTAPSSLTISPEIALPLIREDGSVSKADLYPLLRQHAPQLAAAEDC